MSLLPIVTIKVPVDFTCLSMTWENSLLNWIVLSESWKNSFSIYWTIHPVAAYSQDTLSSSIDFLMFLIDNFLKSTADSQQNKKLNSDFFCLPIFIAYTLSSWPILSYQHDVTEQTAGTRHTRERSHSIATMQLQRLKYFQEQR